MTVKVKKSLEVVKKTLVPMKVKVKVKKNLEVKKSLAVKKNPGVKKNLTVKKNRQAKTMMMMMKMKRRVAKMKAVKIILLKVHRQEKEATIPTLVMDKVWKISPTTSQRTRNVGKDHQKKRRKRRKWFSASFAAF